MNYKEMHNKLWKVSQHGSIDEFQQFLDYMKPSESETLLLAVHKKSGDNVTHVLSRHGQLAVLKLIRDKWKVSLEMVNLDGKMPLHEAAASGHFNVVEYLLSEGVNVDPLKRAGWTPLMMACTKWNNLKTVVLLVNAGANVTLVNKDGWNCFQIASRLGDVDILTFLANNQPNLWSNTSKNGRTPLHTAALHGHSKVVDFLLKLCDTSADFKDSCGSTPFMDAVRSGDIETVEVLLNFRPFSSLETNRLGLTCLHIAAEANQSKMIIYLIQRCRLDVNSQVETNDMCQGQTPLHLAYKEENEEAILTLLKLGAVTDVKDKNNRTPIEMKPMKRWARSF